MKEKNLKVNNKDVIFTVKIIDFADLDFLMCALFSSQGRVALRAQERQGLKKGSEGTRAERACQ